MKLDRQPLPQEMTGYQYQVQVKVKQSQKTNPQESKYTRNKTKKTRGKVSIEAASMEKSIKGMPMNQNMIMGQNRKSNLTGTSGVPGQVAQSVTFGPDVNIDRQE